jgi:hypothetical protein
MNKGTTRYGTVFMPTTVRMPKTARLVITSASILRSFSRFLELLRIGLFPWGYRVVAYAANCPPVTRAV